MSKHQGYASGWTQHQLLKNVMKKEARMHHKPRVAAVAEELPKVASAMHSVAEIKP